MPSSTPERQNRWTNDNFAQRFLESHGYVLNSDWTWCGPMVNGKTRPATELEADAIIYLIEEWDFGGLLTDDERRRWPMPNRPLASWRNS